MDEKDETRAATPDDDFRCGYAAIIGEPNVGKSTFLNAVLGAKLSIVTPKPQTTRKRILGIHNSEREQILFLDTPGLIEPRYLLQASMVAASRAALHESDAVLLMVDAQAFLASGRACAAPVRELLAEARRPTLVLLNKVDLVRGPELRRLVPSLEALFPGSTVFALSSLLRQGISEVIEALRALLPRHPALYPEDALTDLPERFFVAEIIREKIFDLYKDEIPYSTEVVIVDFRERDDIDVISAEILVERDTQRRIVIGTGGAAIKQVGIAARADIEALLGRRVFLELHVKVRERWRQSRAWIQRLGYDAG
jgi:GTP-binding protein Era